nr:MAG TPA: hypothetical protein [Caudoviricetes sp.]
MAWCRAARCSRPCCLYFGNAVRQDDVHTVTGR